MVAKKKTSAAKETKQEEVTLGKAVIVYPRGSQHWVALSAPELIEIQGIKFLQGIQITGNPGHRFEQKKTLMPFELVGTIVQFQEEEDIWSKAQPRNIAPTTEEVKSATLTSHERGSPDFKAGGHQGGNRRNRNRRKGGGRPDSASDARFQQQYDSNKDRNFNR
jgi:hypothetical protein